MHLKMWKTRCSMKLEEALVKVVMDLNVGLGFERFPRRLPSTSSTFKEQHRSSIVPKERRTRLVMPWYAFCIAEYVELLRIGTCQSAGSSPSVPLYMAGQGHCTEALQTRTELRMSSASKPLLQSTLGLDIILWFDMNWNRLSPVQSTYETRTTSPS